MKKVNKETLKIAANNLMFDMSDEEIETLLKEFEVITKQMELLGEIEGLENITPMTFPFECSTSFLREDEPNEPLDREVALKNAHDVIEGQIRLPKVVN